MKLAQLPTEKYIVAVSGGVDSVVLLDLLNQQDDLDLVVAHFDHGMRPESSQDAKFVEGLAGKYGLKFELGQAKLGKDASEEQARNARYEFLRSVRDKCKGRQIITAHHSDDVVETIIINLIRGTGWRGLSSLRNTKDIARPLLDFTKADILAYASEQKLKWTQDSTNQDYKYLRNEIRHKVVPKMSAKQRKEFLQLYQSQLGLTDEIDSHTTRLSSNKRHDFIMWPDIVSLEILRSQLQLTRPQAKRALMAIKTARPGSKLEITAGKSLEFTHKNVLVMIK